MPGPVIEESRVLIIDDESPNVMLLERILRRAGYSQVRASTDPRQALPLFLEVEPDLVLLDLHMPYLDGFGVMEQLKPHIQQDDYLPILILTADITSEAKKRALSGGARDFLIKPLDATEIVLRIHNLLETRLLHLQLRQHNSILEERVRDRTAELEDARLEILERLARAAEYRDFDTGQHAQRVGQISALLAESVGLKRRTVQLIRQAAPLHDIGKIGVSDSILLKPGKLTAEEFEAMKAHTAIGAAMLSGSRSPVLQMAEEIALYHHERWDGTGYAGLKGKDTPISARIVAVADVYDALSSDRPYRPAWAPETVAAEIEQQRGRHFDPEISEAFLRIQSTLPVAASS